LRHDFRSIRPQEARILLLDGSDRVLPPFSPRLSAKAEAQLIRIGVRPRTGVKVVDMDEAGVTVESPQGRERIASRTVIWAAGVHASPFGEVLALRAGAKRERNGQVAVEKDLSLVGHPEIFVIGDLARVHDAAGKPLPGVSPVAMQEGAYVARVIRERLAGRPAPPPFHYFNKGQLAVIGRGAAVADIGRFKVSGVLAWFIWLFVHLMYIVEFSSRVLIFIEWGFLYLTFNRGARLITGRNRLLQTVRMPETADSAATAQADTASR